MDQAQAAQILHSLRAEATEARRTVADAEKRAAALDKLIEGYVELFPALAAESEPEASPDQVTLYLANGRTLSYIDKPKGQEAVLRVLQATECRGRFWSVGEMTKELERRDWSPQPRNPNNPDFDPAGAVRSALDRVAEADPEHVYKHKGRNGVIWFYRHEGMAAPNFAAGERSLAFRGRG